MQGHSIFENSIAVENLASGDFGVLFQTLPVMAAAVRGELEPDRLGWQDTALQGAAARLVTGISNPSSQRDAVFRFVRDSIPYRPDPDDVQIVQDAYATLGWRDGNAGGKCVDKVILLAALLRSLGYVSRFVVQRHGEDFDHVYLEVYDGSEWIALDPTGDGIAPHPLYEVGERQAADEERSFDIFGESMSYGLGNVGQFEGDFAGSAPWSYGQPIPPRPDVPWWQEIGDRIIDVFGADRSNSPYVSPNDPRYRGGVLIPQAPGQVYSSGQSTGFVISNQMLLIGVALLAVYAFGKGRR